VRKMSVGGAHNFSGSGSVDDVRNRRRSLSWARENDCEMLLGAKDMDLARVLRAVACEPLEYSGTCTAVFEIDNARRSNTLVKVFSRNWSSHTRDFCCWAYGKRTLEMTDVAGLARQVVRCTTALARYGVNLDAPLAAWGIPDPFAATSPGVALAIEVMRHAKPSIRRDLFVLRKRDGDVMRQFCAHVGYLLRAIQLAAEYGELDKYTLRYGFDLKPRNIIAGEEWVYLDHFPVLYPGIRQRLRKYCPAKAFRKRYDARYYCYDLLMRYYRVSPHLSPDMLSAITSAVLRSELSHRREYVRFITESMAAYVVKWGHIPQDTDWRFPFHAK
jgi:hypothetical protein